MDHKKIHRKSSITQFLFSPLLNRIETENRNHLTNIVYLFVAFHFCLWFCVGFVSQRAPHWDNVEALVWSQHLAWGYFKHPPFATWVVHFFVEIFGRSFWVTYLVGQLNVALMLLVVWRIGLLLTTPVRAVMAVILTSLIVYYNVWGIVSNHNTLQLLPIALLLWACLLAVRHPQWWRWGLVGLAAAVCILTKYSALIWIAALGIWMITDSRMHCLKPWLGVLFAVLIILIALTPHIEWLTHEGYQTLKYLENQTKQHSNYFVLVGRFLTSQLARLLPLFIAVGLVFLTYKRYRSKQTGSLVTLPPAPSEWRFICLMSFSPLILALLAGAFMMNLRANWGTTFFILAGLFVTRWLPVFDEKFLLQSVLKIGILINLTFACWMMFSNGFLVDMTKRTSRVNFPTTEFVNQVDKIWSGAMGQQPLKLVAAETWLAGVTSVKSRYHPVAYLYGRRLQAPWVSEKMLSDCGVLLLIDRRSQQSRKPPPAVLQLMELASHHGMIEITWSRRAEGPMLTVEWGIIEPAEKGQCNH